MSKDLEISFQANHKNVRLDENLGDNKLLANCLLHGSCGLQFALGERGETKNLNPDPMGSAKGISGHSSSFSSLTAAIFY